MIDLDALAAAVKAAVPGVTGTIEELSGVRCLVLSVGGWSVMVSEYGAMNVGDNWLDDDDRLFVAIVANAIDAQTGQGG